VVLVLLIGLVGGVALGSLAAARRTASSFSIFLAHSNPSDLMIVPAGGGPGVGQPNHAQRLVDAVRRYPQVTNVESYEALSVAPGRGTQRSPRQAMLVGDGGRPRRMSWARVSIASFSSGCVRM
jgi:hypothetical protein